MAGDLVIGLLALILLIFGVVRLIQGSIPVGVVCIVVALVLGGYGTNTFH